MDLFEYMRENFSEDDSPLAKRMRPTSLDDVVGQEHIIGKDKLLYRAIKADKISSLIFYGPPGTGKTTLAMVIANTTKAEFRQLNATTAGKKDMERLWKRRRIPRLCMADGLYCSSMRSTDSTSHSRIISCHLLRMERWYS